MDEEVALPPQPPPARERDLLMRALFERDGVERGRVLAGLEAQLRTEFALELEHDQVMANMLTTAYAAAHARRNDIDNEIAIALVLGGVLLEPGFRAVLAPPIITVDDGADGRLEPVAAALCDRETLTMFESPTLLRYFQDLIDGAHMPLHKFACECAARYAALRPYAPP